MKHLLILIVFSLITIVACDFKAKGPDVSHIDVSVKPKPFFIDLFEMDESNIDEELKNLSKKYGTYLDAYSEQIIKIGNPSSPQYSQFVKSFLNYEDNQEVYNTCKAEFGEVEKYEKELSKAFQHLRYYFPGMPIPEVYFHTSYFNQSIAMDS